MKNPMGTRSGAIPYRDVTPSQQLLPSRNPITISGDTFRGKFKSLTCGSTIKCESLTEIRATDLLEFSKQILHITHQPPTLKFKLDGKRRRYTPDFAGSLVGGGHLLVEVKPQAKACLPEMKAFFKAAKVAAAQEGCRFAVVTEHHFRRPGMKDVKRLLKMRRDWVVENLGGPPLDESLDTTAASIWHENPALQRAFENKPRMSMAEVIRMLGSTDEARWSLDLLLLTRTLAWPISQSLGRHTQLHIYSEIDDEQLFI
ncbi:Tn7 transposase TnsA N-terminal domain-containing protein [Hydrogenophaga sp. UC242_50]|uniref:Tn7 transposase TnsA N-terminal domain-containing protein n=1 Tax=unclassified Hydrogenophaga TaxID=2610897 RepID=UPI0036D39585